MGVHSPPESLILATSIGHESPTSASVDLEAPTFSTKRLPLSWFHLHSQYDYIADELCRRRKTG